MSVRRKRGLFLSVYVGDIKNDFKKTEFSLPSGRNGWNLLILEIQHHFLTTYTWDALNVNANRTRSLLTNTEKCSNHEFLLEQLRHCQGGRILTQKLSRGSTKWKDMRKSALRGTSNWQIKDRAIVQSLSSLLRWSSLQEGTGISWKIVRFSWSACIWQELIDQTFHDP